MRLSRSSVIALALVSTPSLPAQASARAEAKTEAAVLAADDVWLAAERRGDVAALDQRLSDFYRDVEPDGKVHPKAELLAMTARKSPRATGSIAEVVAEFRKQHPTIEQVVIVGDTAILSFYSTDPVARGLVRSLDVFTYDKGMWKGVLSKHSSNPNPAG